MFLPMVRKQAMLNEMSGCLGQWAATPDLIWLKAQLASITTKLRADLWVNRDSKELWFSTIFFKRFSKQIAI